LRVSSALVAWGNPMNRRVSIALLAVAVFAVFLAPLARSHRRSSELPEADGTAITSVLGIART
ncbi:MAG TPA: hypothetical protein VKB61_12065, partial [Candidatus Acidoferrum sp.]|nr:hypothetical protein [Candidatus Acidoferrum sp.]